MKKLERLLKGLESVETRDGTGVEVGGLAYDSRRVKPGDVFVCIRGLRTDGHFFVEEAVRRGAAAVVAERELPGPVRVPFVRVADSRAALGLMAAAFYGHPSRSLRMIGVTGTNGKTTTTYLVKAMLEAAGHKTGLIGTIRNLAGDEEIPTQRTTPESLDLQALLAHMRDVGCSHVVMEVSSHAIELKRIAGVEFDIGVFTNLTQDHLDFHGTFEAYRNAKGKFFTGLGHSTKEGPRWAVINADDPSADFFVRVSTVPVRLYGLETGAEVRAEGVWLKPNGLGYRLVAPEGQIALALRLSGQFNVYNSLAAAAVGLSLGLPLETIRRGLESVPGVPGRFEVVDAGQPFTVVVDYAHTPDGLENLLRAVDSVNRGRKILVFGCGGDRDRGKRPLMGEIAGRLADYTIVTSDNPRSEDPAAICAEVAAGVAKTARGPEAYEVLVDRREAIERALAVAEPGDVVLVAGKGHETYQIFADRTIDFDDREVVRQALAQRKELKRG
ncbi:MAG TPA: UDP-N-acetylmuramoyl-L-alanyl-D-glutamate--2,6-diaminopimelate ligase [Firmicutes bacterium]|nr:UDP-N-acetylmuramoyl-L-alanyl-D-glutamate--2,6-diaminopimelate ligase [Bacillota bacterium]